MPSTSWPAEARSQRVTIDGQDLHYLDFDGPAEAPTIVCVHGLGGPDPGRVVVGDGSCLTGTAHRQATQPARIAAVSSAALRMPPRSSSQPLATPTTGSLPSTLTTRPPRGR